MILRSQQQSSFALESELFNAVRHGHLRDARELVAKGAPIRGVLSMAASNNDFAMMDVLMASDKCHTTDLENGLINATTQEMAEVLIDAGANPAQCITPILFVNSIHGNLHMFLYFVPWTSCIDLINMRNAVVMYPDRHVYIDSIDAELKHREQWLNPLRSLEGLAAQAFIKAGGDICDAVDAGYPGYAIEYLIFTQIAMDRGYNTAAYDRFSKRARKK